MANSERSDRIGYSSSTSSSCWFQTRSRLSASRGASQVRARPIKGGERAVRRERDARRNDARRGQPHVVLGDGDVVDQVELCGIAQRLVGAREIDVALAAQRELDLDQGGERHPDQELEAIARRLHEGVDADVGRDLVRGGAANADRPASAPTSIAVTHADTKSITPRNRTDFSPTAGYVRGTSIALTSPIRSPIIEP